MRSTKRIFAPLVAMGVASLWAAPALACSVMMPEPTFQLDEESAVPATLGGVLTTGCASSFAEEEPELWLTSEDSGQSVDVDIEEYRSGLYEVNILEPLEANATYEFSAQFECSSNKFREEEWIFHTSAEVHLPDDIGKWAPSDLMETEVAFSSAECSSTREAAVVDFEFTPSEVAEDWGRAIAFETYVNGELWEPRLHTGDPPLTGTSRHGWGEERVYAICDEDISRGVDQGTHLVQLKSWLPGTDEVWMSDEFEVQLECGLVDDEPEEEEMPNPESTCATASGSAGGVVLALLAIALVGIRRRCRVAEH